MKSLARGSERMMPTSGDVNFEPNLVLEPFETVPISNLGELSSKKSFLTLATRYKIGDEIGDGNFAKVYKCRMANTQSEFAMKVIKKEIMKGKVSSI